MNNENKKEDIITNELDKFNKFLHTFNYDFKLTEKIEKDELQKKLKNILKIHAQMHSILNGLDKLKDFLKQKFIDLTPFYKKELFSIKPDFSQKALETPKMQNKVIDIKFKNYSMKNLKTLKKAKMLEMPKDIIALTFEILKNASFKLEIHKFRSLTTKIFDTYPILSQKTNNLYNNKELYKNTLLLTWKIIR